MKRSTERILTTHAGRLDGPHDFQEMMKSQSPDSVAQQGTELPDIPDIAGGKSELLHNLWAGADRPLGCCLREINAFTH